MLPDLPESTLAERIRKARILHQRTQADIADSVGVRKASVSDWETGSSRPDMEHLVKLADLFSVTLDWLMGRVTSQKVAS